VKRSSVLIAGGTLLVLACGSWLATCRFPGTCASMAPPLRWPFAMVLAGGALLGAMTIAWLTRVVWILAKGARAVQQLQRTPAPSALSIGAARAGALRVECVIANAPVAFCHGGLRPSILVSAGLVSELSADELLAVLAHEQHHVRRCDPLRRAVQQAVAEVFFWLPVIDWWADRRREASELAADRAAIRRAGRSPLAGALWKVGSYLETHGTAAFAGAAKLRVAQVLGDDLPSQRIPMSLWVGSAAGVLIALNSAWCVAHLFGSA
jgi:BlaR1 peptidase M56